MSSGTNRRRDAERAAAELERDLADSDPDRPNPTWVQFRDRYEAEVLPSLSRSSLTQWITTANWIEKTIKPQRLGDINKSLLSRFTAKLREHNLAEASVQSYLNTLQAALGWAEEVDLVERAPRLRMRRQARGAKQMRSRPITAEEFERIVMAVPKVRPRDAAEWEKFLHGLWHSGLRVDELRRLSWDDAADLAIDTTHDVPLIRMMASGHKARRHEFQPMTPQFWDLIKGGDRIGYVFTFSATRKGPQLSLKTTIRNVAAIGEAAGVITEAATGKTATSHDIGRRAFLTRMDQLLTVPELQKWARHASPQTTMGYYHHRTAVELGRKVWAAAGQ
ncbi:MAG: site-specific integrase [Planctomycetota bacterium]